MAGEHNGCLVDCPRNRSSCPGLFTEAEKEKEGEMKTFWSKWTPELAIALLVILILATLMFTGIDGEVKTIFCLTVGWVIRASFNVKKVN